MIIKNFDEYSLKDTSLRIKSEYVSEGNDISSWEVSHFTNKISTCIYKMDLINSVAMAVKVGINTQNIFIMNDSLKLNHKYANISEWDLNTSDIDIMYSLGRPIGLVPSRKVTQLNLLLELLDEMNQLIYKKVRCRMDTNTRIEAYQMMIKEGYEAASQFVYEACMEKIVLHVMRYDSGDLESIVDQNKKKYYEYLEDEEVLDDLNFKIVCRQTNLRQIERKLIGKYYERFYEYLQKLSRPIVGIYDKDTGKIKVLCSDYFEKSSNHNTKICFQNTCDNSHRTYIIESGLAARFFVSEEEEMNEIIELEKEKLELEVTSKDIMKDVHRIQQYQAEINCRTHMNDAVKEEQMRGLEGLFESYEKDRLMEIYDQLLKQYKNILKNGNFIVKDQISTDFQDFIESNKEKV